MRPPSGPELLLFGRALLAYPPQDRARAAVDILAQVEAADAHLRHHGLCHPCFGDGSLMTGCLRLTPSAELPANDGEFLSALIQACMALRDHQNS